MDVGKLQLPATATVTVTVTETMAALPSSSGAVQLVSIWSLIAACSIFFGRAVDYVLYFFHVHCYPSAIVLRCVYLTHAEAAEKAALWGGILSFAALQTAAASVALLLPSRRRRLLHGLAFIALAAGILCHCAYVTVVHLILAVDPGYLFYRISCTAFIVLLAAGDIVSFIALLLGGGEEQAAAAAGQQEATA